MVEYIKEGKIAVIVGCSDDEKEIEIPEYIDDLPVGKIEANSFNELTRLKKVIFPKNLRLIGSYAFAGCKNLKEIVFKEGLEVIEDWAFISCNIDTINLPNSIKKIGENAFMGNMAKEQVEKFLAKKGMNKKKIKNRKYNATIFPIGLLDSIENIKNDLISERAKYFIEQVDDLEEEFIKSFNLDIPFIFDGDDFLVGIYTHQPLINPKIEVSKESLEKIGLYEENDPDFLQLNLNVMSEEAIVGELVIKTPYLEEANFEIVDVYSLEDNGYRYFIHVNANLGSYGTGNIKREFAFDIFKDLEGKYLTQCKNNLIPEEVYLSIKKEIDDAKIDTLKSFLKQVSGVPVLQYLMSLIEAFLGDEELDHTPVMDFITNKLLNIYNSLGDFASFEDVCFNMKDATRFINSYVGLTLEELKEKYGVYIQDEEGKALTTEEIANYRSYLSENDFNYTLYAEFLNYMYQLMSKMNQEFSMKTYQE